MCDDTSKSNMRKKSSIHLTSPKAAARQERKRRQDRHHERKSRYSSIPLVRQSTNTEIGEMEGEVEVVSEDSESF